VGVIRSETCCRSEAKKGVRDRKAKISGRRGKRIQYSLVTGKKKGRVYSKIGSRAKGLYGGEQSRREN